MNADIFVNLSNHPTLSWGEEQLAAARCFSTHICDMAFPELDPYLSKDEIKSLALEFADKIVSVYGNGGRTKIYLHVMGEMTFVFALVNLLIIRDVVCLASTTKRNVAEIDGKKVVSFKFVAFRQY